MPETDSTRWELSHWAGPPSQLVEAVRLAIAKLAALAPYPEDAGPDDRFDPYEVIERQRAQVAADKAARLSITVGEQDGYSSKLAGLDELAELPERSFDSIRLIAIDVGASGYSTPGVSFRLSRHEGLSVDIRGYERSWTAGLRHQLESILEPEHRPRPRLMRAYYHAVWIAGAVWNVVFDGILWGGLAPISDLEGSARLAIAAACATPFALLVILAWVSSKRFELLRPGQLPRYQRWRKKLLAAAGAVCLGVIATIIAAPLA